MQVVVRSDLHLQGGECTAVHGCTEIIGDTKTRSVRVDVLLDTCVDSETT